ncbi:dna polymerase i domain-containing protein [Cystoisospora suis]|uniref:DNA-directed DNA polymerase n=1 Tax=Cystoisospora suis TaxID=483139 RepID=A0A2C6L083_9APIC|nr:dna polymerase i domain-containing protein [Cystoisospora suis]
MLFPFLPINNACRSVSLAGARFRCGGGVLLSRPSFQLLILITTLGDGCVSVIRHISLEALLFSRTVPAGLCSALARRSCVACDSWSSEMIRHLLLLRNRLACTWLTAPQRQPLLPSQLRCPPSFPPRALLGTRVPSKLSAFPRREGSSVSCLWLLLRSTADTDEDVLGSCQFVSRESMQQRSQTLHFLKGEEYGTEIAGFHHFTSTKTTSPFLFAETVEKRPLLCEPRHAALPSIKKRILSSSVAPTPDREAFVRRVSDKVFTRGTAVRPAKMASALHQASGLLVFYREPPDPGVFFRQYADPGRAMWRFLTAETEAEEGESPSASGRPEDVSHCTARSSICRAPPAAGGQQRPSGTSNATVPSESQATQLRTALTARSTSVDTEQANNSALLSRPLTHSPSAVSTSGHNCRSSSSSIQTGSSSWSHSACSSGSPPPLSSSNPLKTQPTSFLENRQERAGGSPGEEILFEEDEENLLFHSPELLTPGSVSCLPLRRSSAALSRVPSHLSSSTAPSTYAAASGSFSPLPGHVITRRDLGSLPASAAPKLLSYPAVRPSSPLSGNSTSSVSLSPRLSVSFSSIESQVSCSSFSPGSLKVSRSPHCSFSTAPVSLHENCKTRSSCTSVSFSSSHKSPSARHGSPFPLQLEPPASAEEGRGNNSAPQAPQDLCDGSREDGVRHANSMFKASISPDEMHLRGGERVNPQRHERKIERNFSWGDGFSAEDRGATCTAGLKPQYNSEGFGVSSAAGARGISPSCAIKPGSGYRYMEAGNEVPTASCSKRREPETMMGEEGARSSSLSAGEAEEDDAVLQAEQKALDSHSSTSEQRSAFRKKQGDCGEKSVGGAGLRTGTRGSGPTGMRLGSRASEGCPGGAASREEADQGKKRSSKLKKRNSPDAKEVEGPRKRARAATAAGSDEESRNSLQERKRKTETGAVSEKPAGEKSQRKRVVFDPRAAWPTFVNLSVKNPECTGKAEVVRVIESVTELDAVLDEHFTSPASFSYSRMTTTPSSSSVSPLSPSPPYSPTTCVPPPASLSCCTEFGTVLCLFEDGSTTTRSSKRLQEAKYTNRTYRARFPEPVAFLLSLASRRGKTQKGFQGERNTGLVGEKVTNEEKPESNCHPVSTGEHREEEGQPQVGSFQWLHILLPCNSRRFGFQNKTNDCERRDWEISITSASSLTERVWEELRSIMHVEGRCLKSGGPLFCFSSQDTLRPLLQRFPQDALELRALLDARLMHWLLYPDTAGDPSVTGFLDSCVNQVESAADMLMREERQGGSSAAPKSGSTSLGEVFQSEKGESSPADESDCTQGWSPLSDASTSANTRMQVPGAHLSESSFLHQLTVKLQASAADKGASGVSTELSTHWLSAFRDASLLARLALAARRLLHAQQLVGPLLSQEIPMAALLGLLDVTGIAFDVSALQSARLSLQGAMRVLEKESERVVGDRKDLLTSPQQLSRFLFEELRLPVPGAAASSSTSSGKHLKRAASASSSTRKTPVVSVSTSDEVLQALTGLHPIIGIIQSYRAVAKLQSTYIDGLTPLSLKSLTVLSAAEGVSYKVAFKLYNGEKDSASGEENARGESQETKKGEVDGRVLFDAAAEYPSLYRSSLPRLFTRWNQTRTVTGRLSSSYPNLQNIPKETLLPSLPRVLTSAAVAATTAADSPSPSPPSCLPGSPSLLLCPAPSTSPSAAQPAVFSSAFSSSSCCPTVPIVEHKLLLPESVNCRLAFRDDAQDGSSVLVSVDYAQIEMRLLAHFCGQGLMQSLLKNNATQQQGARPLQLESDETHPSEGTSRAGGDAVDLYREMAGLYAKQPPHAVSGDLRKKVKVTCLALIYGSGVPTIAKQMGISLYEAAAFRTRFLSVFPEVNRFIRNVTANARAKGFVTTLAGRRRYIPEVRSPEPSLRALGERLSVNSCIQGSASDLMKIAMLRLQRDLLTHQWEQTASAPRLLLSIHDELVLQCPKAHLAVLATMLRRCMTEDMPVDVPLDVTISSGPAWGAVKKLGS